MSGIMLDDPSDPKGIAAALEALIADEQAPIQIVGDFESHYDRIPH